MCGVLRGLACPETHYSENQAAGWPIKKRSNAFYSYHPAGKGGKYKKIEKKFAFAYLLPTDL
jgi:hypothetical protein